MDFSFTTFESLYVNINKDIILGEVPVIGTSGNAAQLPFLVLESCTTELGNSVLSSYRNSSKFNVLVKKYLDFDRLDNFCKRLKESPATSQTLYFTENKQPEVGRYKNGGCILNLVVRRLKRGTPWTEATIYYRTTQLNRAFAFDLIFFNKLLEILPNSNFEKIRMVVVSPYFDMLEATHQLDLFNLLSENLDPETNIVQKEICKNRDRILNKVTEKYVYHKYRRIANELLNPRPNNCIDLSKLNLFKFKGGNK